MATGFTTKADGAVIYAAHVNALQDGLEQIYFNVKSPVFGAAGNGVNDDTAAINAAIAAADAVDGSRNLGGTVFFPPGTYLCNSPLTCTNLNHVRFLGAGGFIWNTPNPAASVILAGFQDDKLFDITGSANTSFEHLGFAGGQTSTVGADVDHHCIYGTGLANIMVHGCSITSFGGSAVRLTGFGKWVQYTQCTGCLYAYGSLAAQTGSLHLEGTENNVYEVNFNGPGFSDSTHGAYDSGYAAAIYTNGAPNTFIKAVGGYAQVGIVIGTSVTSSPGYFAYCRGEFVQGHGWDIRGGVNAFHRCTAHNVNRDTSTPTYSGFYTVRVSPGFVGVNDFTDCIVTGTDATYRPAYGFTDQNNGAGNLYAGTNHYNAGCRAPNAVTRTFNPTFGVCLPIIQGQNRAQAGSLNTTPSPDELTFNGEDGNVWRAAIASGAATKILAENLLPGMVYELILVQHATPGTVTLDTVFAKTAPFTSPAASKYLSGRFYSDGTSLYQIGAWSGDM